MSTTTTNLSNTKLLAGLSTSDLFALDNLRAFSPGVAVCKESDARTSGGAINAQEIQDGTEITISVAGGGARVGDKLRVVIDGSIAVDHILTTSDINGINGSSASKGIARVTVNAEVLLALSQGAHYVTSQISYLSGTFAGMHSKVSIARGIFNIDTVGPDVVVTSLGDDLKTAAEATGPAGVMTVQSEANATSTVTLVGQNGQVVKTIVHNGTAKPVVLTAADLLTLGNGAVEVTTVTKDKAGNIITSPDVADGDFTLDTIAAVAVADEVNATEDLVSTSANVGSNDTNKDGSETYSLVGSATGLYGTLVLDANGAYTYTRTANLDAIQATVTDTFSYKVTDAAGNTTQSTFKINLAPVNDAAVISGNVAGAVTEAGGVSNAIAGTPTATGTLTSTDVDGTTNAFTAVAAGAASANGYGTYGMTAGGAWTYTLNNSNATVQALAAAATLTDTFTVNAADGTSKIITVTINGSNDTATITGTATGAVTENAAVSTVGGTLTVSDVDAGQAVFQTPVSLLGTYGSFTLNTTTGVWDYTLDNTKPAVQALVAGQQVTDSLLVKSQDGTATQNLLVTITGTNDATLISGTTTGNVIEAGGVANAIAGTPTSTGTLTGTDVNGQGLAFTAVAAGATSTNGYGTYAMTAGGVWTYTLDNSNTTVQALGAGVTVNDTFTVNAADGTAKVVTVTITGTNDAAVIAGAVTGAINEGVASTSGTVTSTDVDGTANAFTAVTAGTATIDGYGTYALTAGGVWTYTLNNANATVNALAAGVTLTDTFTVAAADGTSKVVTVTITGTNDAAVISGTNTGAVIEAGGVSNAIAGTPTATGTLTSTDVDGTTNAFTAIAAGTASTSGYGTYAMTAGGVWTYTLNNANATVSALAAGAILNDTFTVKAADGTAKLITVTITGANDAAIISGNVAGAVTEAGGVANAIAGTPSASGTLTSTDVDGATNAFTAVAAGATSTNGYGTYAMTAAGVWTYTLDNSNNTVQALTSAQILIDTFTVNAADGTAKVVTVTITGTNDAAIIAGAVTGAINEGVASTTGTVTSTDVDGTANAFTAVTAGTATIDGYGTYALTAGGVWTYTLNNANATVNALAAGVTLNDTFTVRAADGTSKVVTVTITGTNDAAVIIGTNTGAVTEAGGVANAIAGTPTASGTLTSTDVDGTTNAFTAVAPGTTSTSGYGTYAMTAAGVWTYTLNNANATVSALAAGAILNDTFTVSAADGTTKTVTVTITGANDAAVIGGTNTGAVTEAGGVSNAIAGTLTATGTLTSTDVDGVANAFTTVAAGTATLGGYGTYALTAAGVWTYTLNNANATVNALAAGVTLNDTFSVAAADGTTKAVTVTITGTNDAAVIAGAVTGAINEGVATTSGTVTSSDVDGTTNAFTPVTAGAATLGGYGTYALTAAGVWTYTLNNANPTVNALAAGVTLDDTFTVAAADGTTKVVTVTITGTNDAAVISGTNTGAVTEAGGVANAIAGTPTASSTLTSTDVDGVANAFTAVTTNTISTGGYGAFTMTAAGVWTYTLNNANTTVQALAGAATLTDTFTVTAADGTAKVVTVTITGANDAAVISGTSTGAVIEAGGVANAIAGSPTATGTLTSTDVDGTNTFTAVAAGTASLGGYGTYAMTAAGVWTYTLNNSNTTVQALAAAATLTDTFTVAAADGTSKVISVTITGSNDAAVISGATTGGILEGVASTSGTVTSTDVDGTANAFTPVTAGADTLGGYGTYALTAGGVWTYTLNNANPTVNALAAGVTLNDTFTVSAADGTAKTVTVTITGTNDAAVISGTSTGAVTEAGGVANAIAGTPTASGTLTSTDVDGTPNAFTAVTTAATSIGGYGSYTMTAAGVWAYTLNNANTTVQALAAGATLTDTFAVGAADGTAKLITITITGSNDAAVISGTNTGAVTEAGGVANGTAGTPTASGTLTSTDVDGVANAFTPVTTAVASSSGYGTYTMTAAGVWTYTLDNSNTTVQALTAAQTLTDTFTVTAADGTAKVVTVTITGTNDAPVVDNLIPDQVATYNAPFSYTIPANTFSDVDGTLTYSATLGSDLALPAWLTFNAATRTFSGTPTSSLDINLKVIVSDGTTTVSDVFRVFIAPAVTSLAVVSATGALNDRLNAGDVATIEVNFIEAVTVTGTPQLALNIGGTLVQANYLSGSGGTKLTFTYTVQAGQNDPNGISINANALTLNGGTIKDVHGNNAILDTPAVADNTSFKVDTENLRTVSADGMDKNFSQADDTTDTWVVYSDGTTKGNNLYVTVAGTESLQQAQMRIDGGAWTTMTLSGNKAVFHFNTALTAGAHAFDFRTLDLAGNYSAVTTQNVSVSSWGSLPTVTTVTAATVSVPNASTGQALLGNGNVQTFTVSKAAIGSYLNNGADNLFLQGGSTGDAGSGTVVDHLTLTGDGAVLNLTDLLGGGYTVDKIQGFEFLDMRASGKQAIVADAISLGSVSTSGWLSNANLLPGYYAMVVRGGPEDTLVINRGGAHDFTGFVAAGTSTNAGNFIVDGITYDIYRNETTKQYLLVQQGVQVSIWRLSVVGAPVNIVPLSVTALQDATKAITDISVEDINGNLSQVQLTVLNGTLSVTLSGTTVSAGALNSSSLTLTGTQAQLNAALATLTYKGDAAFAGTDTLTIVSTDSTGTPLSDTDTVNITVSSVNHAPIANGDVLVNDVITTDLLGAVIPAVTTYSTFTNGASFNNFTGDGTYSFGTDTTVTVSGNTQSPATSSYGDITNGLLIGPLLANPSITSEKVDFDFNKAVSSVTVQFVGTDPVEKIRIWINGERYTLTQGEITGAANGLTLNSDSLGVYLSTSYTGTTVASNSFVISSVPGTSGITSISIENEGAGNGSIFKVTSYANTSTATNTPAATAYKTVNELFGSTYTDADASGTADGTFKGVAITSAGTTANATALGVYQYSSDNGTTWATLASGLTESTAVFLAKTDLIRFTASSSNATLTMKPDLVARLVDSSAGGASTSGQVVDVSGANHGGSTPYSGDTVTLRVPPDIAPPTLVGSNPSDDSYLTGLGKDLVLNFSETVGKGTGLIQLFKADGTLVESFDASTSTALTWSGSNLTINPTSNLLPLTDYYIKIAPTAVKDLSGNPYAGIADATTLNFSTTDEDGGIPPTAMSGAGYVVSSAGDVNGDGFDDVIVGAPTLRNEPYTGAYLAGGAYVIYGNAAGTLPALPLNTGNGVNASIAANVGFKISSAMSANTKFGKTVSGIGDINGDGFDDVMMGGGGTLASAYVVYGGATNAGVAINNAGNINNSQGFKIFNGVSDSTAAFGSSVTGLGDVNGDGVADFGVALGASSWVIYGSTTNQSDLQAGYNFAIDPNRGYLLPGFVTAVGDMNNDGMADVVAQSSGGTDSAATIYYSNANGTANTTNAAYSITGTISNSPMNQVTSMGDVNGDGIADLAVMSSNHVFVVYGQTGTTNVALSTLSASQGFKIVLPVGSSRYDWISSAGDVNGDGLADVIIGKQSGYAAFAMVVYGNATGTDVQLSHILGYSSGYNVSDDAIAPSQGFKISSPDGVNRMGWRVSNAGDFNGDGLADLILGGLPTQDGVFGMVLGGTQFVTNAVQGSGTVNGTSGSEALFGSTANDTLTGGGGVDRFFAGEGDDTIVLTATDVANLANVTTGQTVKASVDGGGGFDTLRLTGGANLNLTAISNVGALGLEENSRIESIERIDMGTDAAANTLTLAAKDVSDMAGFNNIHLGGTTATNADGRVWTNVTGTALSATTKFHQLVVDGSASDVVNFTSEAGWTNAGIVNNGTSNYTVWQNTAKNAQILVQSGVTVASPLSFALGTDTGTSASDFITKNGTMNVSLSVATDTWSYSTDSGTTWTAGSGTSFVVGAGIYAANAVQVRENGAGGQTVAKLANALTVDMAAPTVAVTMSDVALALGETSTVTFQFSENVANFDITDVAIQNSLGGAGAGGLSALTKVSDSKWTAVYTPTTEANTTGNQIVVALNGYNDVAGNNGALGQATFSVDTRFSTSLTAGFYGTTSSSSSANGSVTTNAVIVDYWNPAWQGDTITTYKNGSQIDSFTISGATNSKSLGNLAASPGDTFYSTITHNGTTYNLFNMIKVNPGTAGLTRYDSPLVLDLNGDGVQTVDMAQGTMFDLQVTGVAQATGWVDAHDGLLAMDLNHDGKISSGAELFGSSTMLANGQKAANGWAALAQYDSNGDSSIDSQDDVFDALKVWQDANGNGLTDAGELRSLKDVGVTSINLGHDNTITQQNGNLLQGVSSYTTTDGTTHEVVDAWFQTVTTAFDTHQEDMFDVREAQPLAKVDADVAQASAPIMATSLDDDSVLRFDDVLPAPDWQAHDITSAHVSYSLNSTSALTDELMHRLAA